LTSYFGPRHYYLAFDFFRELTETAPTFVPPSVSVSLVPSNRTVSFKCKFDPHAEKDFYYQVKWRVEDSSTKVLTKQFFKKDNLDGLKLTEDDFVTNDIGLGINVCKDIINLH
jgi:hypothetical protein